MYTYTWRKGMIIPESFALEWTLNLWCFHWSYGRQHRIFLWKSKHGSYKIQKYITYILPKHLIKQNPLPFFVEEYTLPFLDDIFFYDLTCQQLPTGEGFGSPEVLPVFPDFERSSFSFPPWASAPKDLRQFQTQCLGKNFEKPVGRGNFHQFKGCYCSEYMYI